MPRELLLLLSCLSHIKLHYVYICIVMVKQSRFFIKFRFFFVLYESLLHMW